MTDSLTNATFLLTTLCFIGTAVLALLSAIVITLLTPVEVSGEACIAVPSLSTNHSVNGVEAPAARVDWRLAAQELDMWFTLTIAKGANAGRDVSLLRNVHQRVLGALDDKRS